MATEHVKYLIDAEDKATKKLRASADAVKQQVSQVKDVGSKAKASTELVGTMATALGSSGIGGFASELAGLTERISAFSEVAEQGKGGALAFKAGLAVAVGVISLKVGQALGDIIFQTSKFNAEIERATSNLNRLASDALATIGRQFDAEKEKIGLIIDPDEQAEAMKQLKLRISNDLRGVRGQVAAHQKKIAGMESIAGRIVNSQAAIDNEKAKLAAAENLLDARREQLRVLNQEGSEAQQKLELLRAEKQAHDNAKQFIGTLEEQVDLQRMSREQLELHNALKNAASDADKTRISELVKERQHIQQVMAAEKEKAAAAKRAHAQQLADQKRVRDSQQKIVEGLLAEVTAMTDGKQAAAAFRLELQGIDSSTADQIATIQAQIAQIKTPKQQAGAAGTITTNDQRLLTGRTRTIEEKLQSSTEKANQLSADQLTALEALREQLQELIDKDSTVELEAVG